MGFFNRYRRDESADRDEALAVWAKSLDAVTLLRDAEERHLAKVAGVVTKIKVQPRDAPASFEITISDGTGILRAIWLGRHNVAGIRLGVRLVLEGRLGLDPKGRLKLVNPVYEIEAASY